MRDTLPAGLGFVSATGTGWACTAAGQLVTCRYDLTSAAFVAKQVSTIRLTVAVSAPANSVTNTAAVASDAFAFTDPTPADDVATNTVVVTAAAPPPTPPTARPSASTRPVPVPRTGSSDPAAAGLLLIGASSLLLLAGLRRRRA